MNREKMQEHIAKEMLKKIVDNSPNYTERMKYDLKMIIDAGTTPEEVLKVTLSYFSLIHFQ